MASSISRKLWRRGRPSFSAVGRCPSRHAHSASERSLEYGLLMDARVPSHHATTPFQTVSSRFSRKLPLTSPQPYAVNGNGCRWFGLVVVAGPYSLIPPRIDMQLVAVAIGCEEWLRLPAGHSKGGCGKVAKEGRMLLREVRGAGPPKHLRAGGSEGFSASEPPPPPGPPL